MSTNSSKKQTKNNVEKTQLDGILEIFKDREIESLRDILKTKIYYVDGEYVYIKDENGNNVTIERVLVYEATIHSITQECIWIRYISSYCGDYETRQNINLPTYQMLYPKDYSIKWFFEKDAAELARALANEKDIPTTYDL